MGSSERGQAAVHSRLIDRIIDEGLARDVHRKGGPNGAAEEAASLPPTERCEFICEVLPRTGQLGREIQQIEGPPPRRRRPYDDPTWQRLTRSKEVLLAAILALLEEELPFSDVQLDELCVWLTDWAPDVFSLRTATGVVKALEDRGASECLPETTIESLEKVHKGLVKISWKEEGSHRLAERVERLLNRAPETPLHRGEAWADAALDAIARMGAEERRGWAGLIAFCKTASGIKPSKRWRKRAAERVAAIGESEVASRLAEWFALVSALEPKLVRTDEHFTPVPALFMDLGNADALRGLLWVASSLRGDDLARRISDVARFAATKLHTRKDDYRGLSWVIRGDSALTGTCLWALGEMDDDAAFAQLVGLKNRFRHATMQKRIEKALSSFATRRGLSRDDLDEMGVPTFGLDDAGVRRCELDDSTLELRIDGSAVKLVFVGPDGESRKTVPKQVADAHPEQLKELKQSKKDVAAVLTAQRERLDRLFVAPQTVDLRSVAGQVCRPPRHRRFGEKADLGVG